MKDFLKEYEQVPVEEYPNHTRAEPVVSVCVQTYQHVGYIHQCLEGLVMQKTRFPYEILLGEDDSKDGTREICLSYARRYPDKIRLFLHHRANNIEICGNPTGRFNFLYNLNASRGRYIAFCEGDDYWTDPNKLQKQVDFLETNRQYIGVVHHTYNLYPDKTSAEGKRQFFIPKSNIKKKDLYKGWQFHNNALMIRNIKDVIMNWDHSLLIDRAFVIMLAHTGKIGVIPEVMSVYRRHAEGQSGIMNRNWNRYFETELFWLENLKQELGRSFIFGYYYIKARIYEKYIIRAACSFPYSRWVKFKYYVMLTLLTLLMYPRNFKTRIHLFSNYFRFGHNHPS